MKVENKSNNSIQYIENEIKDNLNNYPNRLAGSQSELHLIQHFQEELKSSSDTVKIDNITVSPIAHIGWIYFLTTFMILGAICYYMAPIMAVVSYAIAIIPFILEHVLNMRFLDPIFDKNRTQNTFATLKSSSTTKRRIIFTANSDAGFEWRYKVKGGKKLSYALLIVVFIGFIIQLTLAILGWSLSSPLGTPGKESHYWLIWLGLIPIPFFPFYLLMSFFFNTDTASKGANSNLSSCELVIALLKDLKENGKTFENTEVCALITSGKQVGLRGAKDFCENNPSYDEDGVETVFISLENLNNIDDLVVIKRDMFNLIKNDKSLVSFIEKVALDNNYKITKKTNNFKSSESAIFSRYGFSACCITNYKPINKEYYKSTDDYESIKLDDLNKIYSLLNTIIVEFDKTGIN